MDAESMNKQEQLHIKDNTTLHMEKSDNGMLCKVDSHSDILSKPAENITEVISPSMQTGSDSGDDEVSCQSSKQFPESLQKPMTIDIDSKVAGAAEVKSQSVLELSDDYLTQMMKNNNDRGIALYEGAFLVSDTTESSEVQSDHAKKDNLLPVQGSVVTDVSNGAENKAILDKIEMVENNENITRNADVKEELVTIDDAHVERVDNNGKIEEFDTSRQDLLPNTEFLIADGINSFDNTKETERDLTLDKIEMVDQKNNDNMEISDPKEKPMLTDNEEVDNNEKIDKSDTGRQDLLPNTELLIANETNSYNDTKETGKDSTLDKIEVVDEKNSDNMEISNPKEKPMSTDNAPDEEVDNNDNIYKSDTGRQDLVPNTELLIVNETNSFNDTKETEKDLTLDRFEMVDEKNNANMEISDLKEKPMSTNNALDQQVDMKKYVDKSITNEQNFLSSREHFMVDKSNSSSDMNESKNEFCRENIDKLKSAAANISNGKMPLVMLENVDVKKGFSRHELKDVNPTEESSAIIAKMRNMDWLKNLGGGMEGNRRKMSRKPSIEPDVIQKDVKGVKEEPTEDAKLSSKSAKKRSSQSKNRKARAVDSPKQDTSEDQNKKSSSDVRSANTSKSETSKSTNVRAVEKSKDTRSNPQILELPRSSIGRGRNDRRKVSLGYSQPKAQSDTSDQWNKTPKVRLENAAIEEKSYNKDKAPTSAGSSLVEVEVDVKNVEYVTENVVVSDFSNSKKPEVCETEIESRLADQPDNSMFSHNQSSVKNNENESTMQKNEEKIDMMKKQLPVVKNDEDSQNKTNKNLSSRPIYGRSTDESNPEKNPSLFVKGFSQNMHDSNKQENCAIKNTGFYNISHETPRWNHNNYSNRQNMNNFGLNSQKGFTSNRHRNITEEENKQNEESFAKNQMLTDKYQGSKGYSDKCYDNKTSGARYNEKNQDNRHFNYQYSDKNQDHRNHGEWNSTKNQEGKSYRDIVSDKNQSSQGDRYFLNQNNNGFGDRYSERFQDRAYGERYSDKVRDSKNSTDRYPDRNQQSKTFRELSSDRHHDENQMVTKKQEPLNRNSVGFDRNNDSNQAKDKEFFNRHQVNSGKYQDTRNSSNKNNDLYVCERHRKEQEQEMLDKYRNQFLKTPEPEDSDKMKQNKSDVKSQKHYDNIQQAKVQKGVHELQQSFSVPSVVHQPERSSSVDQKEKDEGLTNTQTIQSGDWTSYENTSKQDAVYSADFRCASPYTNINTTMNATVTNEYGSQYNESLLNSSNQFDSVSNARASEQKLNVVMPFEGNQSVQRGQGMDTSHFGQNQSSVNTNDLFRSNANSPTPQQVCASANAAQFLETITSGLVDPTTTSTYPHSTMNVNAPPFEVTSNEKLNDQLMCMQYATLNSQAGLVNMDNDCMLSAVLMNEMSHFNEEQLKLNQEIKELRQKLAIKQSELMASQMKMFNTAKATTKAFMKQSINPSLQQQISYSQLVQQQNQLLPSNYAQVKHPNVPPGFGDVSLNVQNTQINVSEVSTNVANVQNYPVQKLPLNSVSGARINAQPVYLAQGNMVYQQQTTNYQTYTDKTANSAAYNIVPQTAEQRQIRGGVIQFPKQ